MINIEQLKEVFQDKLSKTGSLDQAFTKAVWIAYNKGLEEGLVSKSTSECGISKIDSN